MLIHQPAIYVITGDTEVTFDGYDCLRLNVSGMSPRLIGITDPGFDGLEIVIHNLSGGNIDLVHRSASVTTTANQLVLTGGVDYTMANEKMVWGVRVAPTDGSVSAGDCGWYLDAFV